jgi:uncharacterized damage-inducible protein DinB
MSTSYDLIRFAYRYNTWANDIVLTAMEQLSADEYSAPGCSGHGSIRDTFAHGISSTHVWFLWFEGKITIAEVPQHRIPGDRFDTVAKARSRWEEIRARTDAYLDSVTDESIEQYREWQIPTGPRGRSRLWQMLFHVANHGTHHRAQIVAAVRRAGYNPGNVEMLAYVMTHPDG